MVSAVILGGGEIDERLRGYFQGASKGLIPVANKTCIEYVLEAVRATEGVEKVALVGPTELTDLPAARLADVHVPEPAGIVDKLVAATEVLGDDKRLLFASCDAPLATPGSLADVIRHDPGDCAALLPLVKEPVALKAFPDKHWYFVKLRDAVIVGCNVMILDPRLLLQQVERAREMENARQKPWRLALMLGLPFLLRFKLGRLGIADCEERISQLIGAPCRSMFTEHAELAVDLDRPEDVPVIERALVDRERGARQSAESRPAKRHTGMPLSPAQG
jgi:molybdopterin-guanine dinucleotide biosynthesis protein A